MIQSCPARAGSPSASTWPTTSTPTSSPIPRTASPSAPARNSWSSCAAAAAGAGKPETLGAFLAAHPNARRFVEAPKPIPTSFTREAFFAVTSFKFINAQGVSRHGRFRIRPEEGVEYLSDEQAAAKSADFLFDEIGPRLARSPVRIGVFVQLAGDGDDVTDSSVPWPEGRTEIPFGVITLSARVDRRSRSSEIIFDPIPRVDGIDTSGDPLSEVRSESICSAAAGAGPRLPLEPAHGKQPHHVPREPGQTWKSLTSPCWAVARRASSSPGHWRRRASGRPDRRKYLGGSCPNIACLPSKNVIHTAKVASNFRRSEEFGVSQQGWKINIAVVRDGKRKMVDGLMEMHCGKIPGHWGGTSLGNGCFVAPKTIEVMLSAGGTRVLHGKTVVINSGSRPGWTICPGCARPGR